VPLYLGGFLRQLFIHDANYNSALMKDTGDNLTASMTIGIATPGTNVRTTPQGGLEI
jgi:hypothetical protein